MRPPGRFGLDVEVFALPQPSHGGREFAPGDLQSGVAQADQLDDETAADPDRDDQGGGHGRQSEEDGRPGRGEQASGERIGAAHDIARGAGLDVAHALLNRGEGVVPGRLRHGLGRVASGRHGQHLVLGGAERGVRGLTAQRAPGGAFRAAQVGRGGVGEGAARVDGASECGVMGKGERARELGRTEQGILTGQHLRRAAELVDHARVGAERAVLDASERTGHVEGERDGVGVLLVGGVPARLPTEGVRPQGRQLLGAGHEPAQPVGRAARKVALVGNGVLVAEAKLSDRAVGALGLLGERGRTVVGRGGQVPYCRPPFGLELGDSRSHGRTHLLVDTAQLAQSRDVLRGHDGGESPEGQQRDDRNHQQRHDLGPDGRRAQPPAQPRLPRLT